MTLLPAKDSFDSKSQVDPGVAAVTAGRPHGHATQPPPVQQAAEASVAPSAEGQLRQETHTCKQRHSQQHSWGV